MATAPHPERKPTPPGPRLELELLVAIAGELKPFGEEQAKV